MELGKTQERSEGDRGKRIGINYDVKVRDEG